MQILSENQLDAFPEGSRIWMLLNGDYLNTYLRFPVNLGRELEIIGFIEKEDAEQMVNLLKTFDPFKTANIALNSELLKDVRREARIYNEYIYFLSHDLAQEFFGELLQANNEIK